MAQALGVRFLDADGQALAANGGNLARVASIEMNECDPRLANCHIEVACDVDNPLVGARRGGGVWPAKRGNAGDGRRAGTGAAKLRPCFTTAN